MATLGLLFLEGKFETLSAGLKPSEEGLRILCALLERAWNLRASRAAIVKVFGFRHGHERGICQIHWVLGILPHQLKCAIERFDIEKPHGQSTVRDEMNEVCGTAAARREQVKCLREDGRCGSQRLGDGRENLNARGCESSAGSKSATIGPV